MSASGQPGDRAPGRPVPLLVQFIATGFFSGYIPWASGTFGTLLGLLVCLIPGVHTTGVLVPLIIFGFVLGVYTAGKVAEAEGDRLSSNAAAAKAIFQPGGHTHPDPSIVVIDEIVGIWVSLVSLAPSLLTYLLAFAFFRVFDVLKPEPAHLMEHLPGGWGIMLDDVIAGLYANLTVHVLLFLILRIPGAAHLV